MAARLNARRRLARPFACNENLLIPRHSRCAMLGSLSRNLLPLSMGSMIGYSCSWTFLHGLRIGPGPGGLRGIRA